MLLTLFIKPHPFNPLQGESLQDEPSPSFDRLRTVSVVEPQVWRGGKRGRGL